MVTRRIQDCVYLAECHLRELQELVAEFPTARRVEINGKIVYAAQLTEDQFRNLDFAIQPGFAVPYTCGDAVLSKHLYSDEHLTREWMRWPIQRVINVIPDEEMKKIYKRLLNTTPRSV